MEKDIYSRLAEIQKDLKAPKGQFNSFGKYSYRSLEDIFTALKPLLNGEFVTCEDDVVMVGNRIYVKATVSLSNGKERITSVAFAREPEDKKGADASQITGAASSYARKYALNGLFAIDDTRDADSQKPPEEVSEGQAATISALIEEVGADESKFLGFFKIKKISDLPANRYAEAVKLLEAKR